MISELVAVSIVLPSLGFLIYLSLRAEESKPERIVKATPLIPNPDEDPHDPISDVRWWRDD